MEDGNDDEQSLLKKKALSMLVHPPIDSGKLPDFFTHWQSILSHHFVISIIIADVSKPTISSAKAQETVVGTNNL